MNGDTRATLGMIFQCIISLPEKWSSLLLPMVSAVFKSIILPVKMKNSLIHCFCKEVSIWVNVICLLSVTVQSVADVGWCAVFYLWAAAYCRVFLPLWPGKAINMNGIHCTVWGMWGLFLHGKVWDSCKFLGKPFWWQKIGKVYERLLKRNEIGGMLHCVQTVAASAKTRVS